MIRVLASLVVTLYLLGYVAVLAIMLEVQGHGHRKKCYLMSAFWPLVIWYNTVVVSLLTIQEWVRGLKIKSKNK